MLAKPPSPAKKPEPPAESKVIETVTQEIPVANSNPSKDNAEGKVCYIGSDQTANQAGGSEPAQ